MCERERRTLEAIKLYNIAGAHDTVIACLAQALGDVVTLPEGGDDDGRRVETTAREIFYHYSRLNRAAGRARDAVGILLRLREASAAKEAESYEAALEAIEATELVPLEGDAARLNRRAAEFEASYDDSVKRNLPTYLPLTMEVPAELHRKAEGAAMTEAARKIVGFFLLIPP
jgi:nuclear pore complex protein Nup93